MFADLASLTKTTATLLAVMKLYDKGRLNLTDRVDYLPWLQDTDKRILLSGNYCCMSPDCLPLLFYLEAIDKESYEGLFSRQSPMPHILHRSVYVTGKPEVQVPEGADIKVRTAEHTLQVSDSLWLNQLLQGGISAKIINSLRDRRYRYSCVGFILLQQLRKRVRNVDGCFLEQGSMLRWD